jgi:hypothetical protein
MTRNTLIYATLFLAAIGPAAAQFDSGSSSGSSIRSLSTSRSSTTGPAPPARSPSAVTQPNNQVAPSSVGLPGGGTQVPGTQGSGIGTTVPIYGTQDNSGIGQSINESEQRSSSTDCTGSGTRSSSGSGSTSSVTTNCASPRGSSLGTQSIIGSGSAIDVSR